MTDKITVLGFNSGNFADVVKGEIIPSAGRCYRVLEVSGAIVELEVIPIPCRSSNCRYVQNLVERTWNANL